MPTTHTSLFLFTGETNVVTQTANNREYPVNEKGQSKATTNG